jgi:hypothetical protein
MNTGQARRDAEEQEAALPQPAEETLEQFQAWEMIENGRYMPRRIRGSFRGRALG